MEIFNKEFCIQSNLLPKILIVISSVIGLIIVVSEGLLKIKILFLYLEYQKNAIKFLKIKKESWGRSFTLLVEIVNYVWMIIYTTLLFWFLLYLETKFI